jgi:hypothetical protein
MRAAWVYSQFCDDASKKERRWSRLYVRGTRLHDVVSPAAQQQSIAQFNQSSVHHRQSWRCVCKSWHSGMWNYAWNVINTAYGALKYLGQPYEPWRDPNEVAVHHDSVACEWR